MGAVIPAKILGLEGHVINGIAFDEASGRVRIIYNRGFASARSPLWLMPTSAMQYGGLSGPIQRPAMEKGRTATVML